MTATHLHAAPLSLPPMAVHAYVHTILEAANSLLRNGFEIMAFQADIVTPKPVLWLKDCLHLRKLASLGQAGYDRAGTDENGPYRIGSFDRCGVTCQWLERVPG